MEKNGEIEVGCGVCDGTHFIQPEDGEYTCSKKQKPYWAIFGKVRSKSSKGDKTTGTRTIKLRARHGEQEELHEWSCKYGEDIEAKSGDEFVIVSRNGKVTGFTNLTIMQHTAFQSGCLGLLVLLAGVAGLFVVLLAY